MTLWERKGFKRKQYNATLGKSWDRSTVLLYLRLILRHYNPFFNPIKIHILRAHL